ncbi:MAG: enoyl-CoA hydratase-related protein [Gammaproteobacteria bacterium]|nr:enoyl-CoA hydratase-related protein [Gammaproteobacteria bacterium]
MDENIGIFLYNITNNILTITINNPPRNRLPDPVFTDPDLLELYLNEPELKGAILHGDGKNFCEGAAIDNDIPMDIVERMNKGKRILDILEESPVPVIAAINGACFGGGLEIALACHIRIVGKSSLLGFPEAELGIMPGLAGTLRSVEEVGYAKALPLILSSDYVSGEKAVEIGLAHYVVPRQNVYEKAVEILDHLIKDKDSKAINYIMKSVIASKRMSRKDALELETKLVVELVESKYNSKSAA